jgi:hypothetical protein
MKPYSMDIWDFLLAFVYDRDDEDTDGYRAFDGFVTIASAEQIARILGEFKKTKDEMPSTYERLGDHANIMFDSHDEAETWLETMISKMERGLADKVHEQA